MTTLEDSTELQATNTLSSGLANTGKFSAYDALENLRCEGQDLAAYLSQLLDFPIHTQQRKIILRASEKLNSLLSNWEEAYEFLAQELESLQQKVFFTQHSNLKSLYDEQLIAYKDQEISLLSKLERKKAKWITREEMLQKEIEQIRLHLEEGQEVFMQQMNSIQESVKKQELARQRIESKYISHLGEVDKELDEILHMHKKGAVKENYGVPILPQLFTPEELEEENRLALGEQSRRILKDVKMPRINVPDDEKIDINPESEEPSYGSIPELDGTRKVIYDKLRDLRDKVYSFRHQELTTDSTDNELTISLPSELRSLSQTEENIVPVLQNISQKITRGKTVLILNQNTRRHGNSSFILGVAGIVFGAKNEQEFKSEITKLIKDSKQLSLEEQEGLVYSLLNEYLPNGQDAKLDDILSISKIDNSGIEVSDHKSGYIFAQEFSSIENSKDHSNFVQEFSGLNSQNQILEQKGIASIKCESPIQGNLNLIISSGRNDSFEDFFDKSKEETIDLDCSKFLKSKRSEEPSDFLELSRIEEVNSPKAEVKSKFNIPKLNLNLLRKSFNEPGFILAPEKATQKDDKKHNTTLKKIESPKKFQIEKREPVLSAHNESSFIIAPEQNSSFFNTSFFELAPKVEEERGRPREKTSKPPSRKDSRVLLKAEMPEESISLLKRPKLGQYEEENSIGCLPPIHLSPDESVSMISNASSKISSSSSKKLDTKIMKSLQTPSNKKIDNKVIPISIQKKLPIIPVKPPPEAPKQFVRNVRGRSLQPINPSQLSTPHSPMSYNKAVPSESVSVNLDTRSESPPTLANRFRIRRFKEVTRPALKSGNFSFFTPKKPVIAKH